MRVALFGGSFDPPHRGHLAIARAAARSFRLDRVLFAPAGRQPLKREGHSAEWAQRLAMVQIACAEAEACGLAASSLDAPRADGTPNYTADTLAALTAEYPEDEIFALAGADSFRTIGHWHAVGRLFTLARWIVVSRPGVPLALPPDLALTPAEAARIHLLDSVHEEVAATDLRHRLAAGDPCEDLLAPGVVRYIQAQNLYRA